MLIFSCAYFIYIIETVDIMDFLFMLSAYAGCPEFKQFSPSILFLRTYVRGHIVSMVTLLVYRCFALWTLLTKTCSGYWYCYYFYVVGTFKHGNGNTKLYDKEYQIFKVEFHISLQGYVQYMKERTTKTHYNFNFIRNYSYIPFLKISFIQDDT